jgi:hypothetical protein
MLAGCVTSSLYRTFVGKALLTLDEQFFSLATALTALGVKISSQSNSPAKYLPC